MGRSYCPDYRKNALDLTLGVPSKNRQEERSPAPLKNGLRDVDNALAVYITFTDGSRTTLETTVEIVLGDFIRQQVTVAPDKGYLLDIETERSELARLESVVSDFLSAVRRATNSAWSAGTITSGVTPVPSQFVLVIGLIARPVGTNMPKCSLRRKPPPGCAPPPVVSPMIVARFKFFRL